MIIWGITTVLCLAGIQFLVWKVKSGGKAHWFFSSREKGFGDENHDLKLKQVAHIVKSLQFTTLLLALIYIFFWTIGRFDYIGMAFIPALVVGLLYAVTAVPTEVPQE